MHKTSIRIGTQVRTQRYYSQVIQYQHDKAYNYENSCFYQLSSASGMRLAEEVKKKASVRRRAADANENVKEKREENLILRLNLCGKNKQAKVDFILALTGWDFLFYG